MKILDCVLNRLVTEIRVDNSPGTSKYNAVNLFKRVKALGYPLDVDYIEQWLIENRPHFLERSRNELLNYAKGVNEGRKFRYYPEFQPVDGDRFDSIIKRCQEG